MSPAGAAACRCPAPLRAAGPARPRTWRSAPSPSSCSSPSSWQCSLSARRHFPTSRRRTSDQTESSAVSGRASPAKSSTFGRTRTGGRNLPSSRPGSRTFGRTGSATLTSTTGGNRGAAARNRGATSQTRGAVGRNRGTSSQSRYAANQNRGAAARNRGTTSQSRYAASQTRGAASRNRGATSQSRYAANQIRGAASQSRGRAQARPSNGRVPNRVLTQSPTVNFNCPEPDGFFENSKQCDKYYECKEGVAKEQLCPDGLLFHPNRSYPCVYPTEVECGTRSAQQDPQPTEDCPRQHVTFKTGSDPSDCSTFIRCISGRAYPSACPDGLAFNATTLGCEWADEVEGCDASGYLGFQCEQRDFTADQVGEFTRVPHPSDCTKFYICFNKADGSVQPRLQGCPEPAVFDPEKEECNENPEEVAGCSDAIPPGVLATFTRRKQDETDRREARLAALKARLQG
ncbi:uncharacterized protein LOC119100577 [Pollicipes pollicipes]|uniref:uncharacterized protein LOC119100577 n=1 Tax=Pollicipes pollicipes TaxID=41117 RepID=UPI0018858A4C|nr:uncharacterized protein LOC119100577 [Pollicipes pollicipes]